MILKFIARRREETETKKEASTVFWHLRQGRLEQIYKGPKSYEISHENLHKIFKRKFFRKNKILYRYRLARKVIFFRKSQVNDLNLCSEKKVKVMALTFF